MIYNFNKENGAERPKLFWANFYAEAFKLFGEVCMGGFNALQGGTEQHTDSFIASSLKNPASLYSQSILMLKFSGESIFRPQVFYAYA